MTAIIGLVLRDHADAFGAWLKTLPESVELVEIVHEDSGLVILTLNEFEQCRTGHYEEIRRRVRTKLRSRRWATPETGEPLAAKEAKP